MCSISKIPVVGKTLDKVSNVIVEVGTHRLRFLGCFKSFMMNLNEEKKKVEVHILKLIN